MPANEENYKILYENLERIHKDLVKEFEEMKRILIIKK